MTMWSIVGGVRYSLWRIDMNNLYKTRDGLSRFAKRLKRELKIPHNKALKLAAEMGGYNNFNDAKKHLLYRGNSSEIEIITVWADRKNNNYGSCTAKLMLQLPLETILKNNIFYGYLANYVVRDNTTLISNLASPSQDMCMIETQRAARTLQFTSITGIKPALNRYSKYPSGDFENRPPLSDHDKFWYDLEGRINLFTAEPYLNRSEIKADAQKLWEQKHGWKALNVNWGSIYGIGTKLYLCCPEYYESTLEKKIKKLEASPSAYDSNDIKTITYN